MNTYSKEERLYWNRLTKGTQSSDDTTLNRAQVQHAEVTDVFPIYLMHTCKLQYIMHAVTAKHIATKSSKIQGTFPDDGKAVSQAKLAKISPNVFCNFYREFEDQKNHACQHDFAMRLLGELFMHILIGSAWTEM